MLYYGINLVRARCTERNWVVRKELQGKLCAYCSVSPGITADHVLARSFLLTDMREGLPTVPACEKCNNDKAKLEHYLTAVLPFGATHSHATKILGEMVPPRLEKNRRLKNELADGLKKQEGLPDGQESLTIPIDGDKIIQLFGFIAKGLAWHHRPESLTPNHDVKVIILTGNGEKLLWDDHISRMKGAEHVSANLGEGSLVYDAIIAADSFHLSVWRFDCIGGSRLDGDETMPSNITNIFAIVGRREFVEKFNFD